MANRPETPTAPRFREGERRLAAVAFTDIVGYSGVVHRNEKLGQRMVDRQDKVVRAVLPSFDGHVVKSTGDGFLLEFGSALSAVKALATIQARLAIGEEAAACPVPLRTSVHLGDVDHVRGDLYGDGVNISARLMPLAPEGGLAISAAVLMQVRQQLDIEFRSIGTPELKNITVPLEVFVAEPAALHALAKEIEAESPDVIETKPSVQPPRQRAWIKPLAAVGIVLLVAAAGFGLMQRSRTAGPATDPSKPALAVLPFANTGGDPANEYFSDGLSEELINTLGRVNTLKVVGRTSSFRFKNTSDDARTIGGKLGVGYLVDGSVRKAADRVRIAISLVRTADGADLWSDSYDRELKDIFSVQSEIATAVTGQLQRSLGIATTQPSTDQPGAGKPPSGNVEAYQALLQGKFYARRNNGADLAKAVEFLDQAIALDPRYALAYAQFGFAALSRVLVFGGDLAQGERDALIARGRGAIVTALQLDPNLAEAHMARAHVLHWLDLRTRDAEREARRAAELAPNDPAVLVKLGQILAELGDTAQALASFDRAIALDPLSRQALYERGVLLDLAGRLEESEASLRKAVQVEPQAAIAHAYLAVTKLHQGDPAAAVAVAREEPDPVWRRWALSMALFTSGDRKGADAELEAFIREYADYAAFQISEVYAWRQDPDAVFRWLDHALEVHDGGTAQIHSSPLLAAYRSDPRYAAFVRKAGLDQANAPAVSTSAEPAK